MRRHSIFVLFLCLASSAFAQAPAGSAFTYQGRLKDAGVLANGPYDFRFILFDSIGISKGLPFLDVPDVPVAGGLFTVVLDFGSAAFDGNARYLEVQVRPGASTGSYTILVPRQQLTPAPYALAGLQDWGLAGNAGTTPPASYLGTSDSQPLVLKTNGAERARLDTSGKLGIGTTSPQQPLSVNGAAVLDQTGTNAGTVNPGLTFGSASGEGISSKRTATGNQFGLDFYTAFTPRLSITNGGNVGIGTTSPAHELHVLGSNAGGSSVGFIYNSNASGTSAPALRLDGLGDTPNGVLWINAFGTGKIASFTNGSSEVAAIDVAGNLSANNLPGAKSSQHGNPAHLSGEYSITNDTADVDSLTITVPAAGIVLVWASVNTTSDAHCTFDLYNVTAGQHLVGINVHHTTPLGNSADVSSITWTLPVSPGSLTIKTTITDSGGGTFWSYHQLAAAYLPVVLGP
jgi:hypothetical protein